MPWVRFTGTYTFTPDEDRRIAIKYREGCTYLVRSQCADKALAAGKAVASRRPARKPARKVP